MTILDLMVVSPEVVLAIFAFVLLVFGAVCGDRVARGVEYLAITGLIVAAICVLYPSRTSHLVGEEGGAYVLNKMFLDNAFTVFVKTIVLAASAISILLAMTYNREYKIERPEFAILILFATIGMMLMVSASDMISLYVGLELQSLALYVLAAFQRDDKKSSEAGLKYFVLGALSSGILLYGISLLYGYAGSTDFIDLAFRLKDPHTVPLGVIFGLVFVCAGLAFKVSAVPFHMWTPDVYQGAPTPVTAFFSAGPKIAAMALFTRVLLMPLNGLAHQWTQILVFIAVASMGIGCFAGIMQTNIKRLMAYSSIANVGFMLVALTINSQSGIQALLIYITIYFLNTLGVFAVILCMRRDGKNVEQISDLAGLGRTNPLVALAMVVFMFSMAGVPPFAGFFGKYFVFLAAVKAGMVPLAVIGVLTSVVSAFYYLRIIKIMYFDDVKLTIDPLPGLSVQVVLVGTSLFMVVFTAWPSPLVDGALRAARSIIGG